MIDLASVVFAATSFVLAFTTWLPAVFVMLALGGAAWLATLSTLNISVQTIVSPWVKARVLSIYMMSVFGGMALGSWVFGHIAELSDTSMALAAAGALLLASPLLRFLFPLVEAESIDTRPAPALPEPRTAARFDQDSGPVLVSVEYRIDPADLPEFERLMAEVRRVRRRDGAVRWGLYQDVADTGRWVELFRVATWLEHMRQHRRGTMADRTIFERVAALHRGPQPPAVSHQIRREPGAASESAAVSPPF
jgi:MFS family permease